jgi:hypothetical protein
MRRIRRSRPPVWLEHVADLRYFAGRTYRRDADQAYGDEIGLIRFGAMRAFD